MSGRSIAVGNGLVAWVDDADFETVSQRRWSAYRGKRTFYVRSGKVRLHSMILSVPPGMVADHIDGDGLNNRRSNLRVCTPAENSINRASWSKYGFKGVSYKPKLKLRPWQAALKSNGRRISLGHHATIEDAARAYDAGARATWGPLARLNFPEQALSRSSTEGGDGA